MKTLYADSLQKVSEDEWNLSTCCSGIFWIAYIERDSSLALICSFCGRPNIKLAIRPPLSPLCFTRRGAFKVEDGKILLHLMAEMDTEEYWREFHTGARRLVRVLLRERDRWSRWRWPIHLARELATATMERLRR